MQLLQKDVASVLVLLPNGEKAFHEEAPVVKLIPEPYISPSVRILKRSFDVVFSLGVMTLGFPVFLLLYLVTKFSSKGPAFYKQERLGLHSRPFIMYKFRSMYVGAEKHGPRLSSQSDTRITKWGRIIRRTRLDELPQFWNVFKGEMSIVGPRPERHHYAQRIISRNPNYKRLTHIKPGITSIGQVHYGYAENVDQMCERLKYDLLYLQNINMRSDLKIIYKTVRVMLQGKGQ
jgi:lipopolysaccharide/colanic/teichoic acid biosynthesis glycosyltransferase